jgi:hypothetical protein
LALADTTTRDAFFRDLSAAQLTSRHGIVSSRANANDSTWRLWTRFCADLVVDPTLQSNVCDPIHLLLVFSHRYRTGAIAPRGRPVKSRTVEGAVRAVGQTLASMGSPDPRLTPSGKHEFRLGRLFAAYGKKDDPPSRVKPVPIQVIQHAHALAAASPSADNMAVANIILIAFFFLMRPGEHTVTKDNTPFKLKDIQFHVGPHRYNATTIPLDLLDAASFVTYTYDTQKNAQRNEAIGLGRSGHGSCCPVAATAQRVQHLRQHHATPDTPLGTYFLPNGTSKTVSSDNITQTLRFSLRHFGTTLGITASDISARSLRAAGAMALLCAHVDHDTIRLIGRWRSDEMLRYLHTQAQPVMYDFSRRMVQGGNYTFIPNNTI